MTKLTEKPKKIPVTYARKKILEALASGTLIEHFSGFGNRMREHSWLLNSDNTRETEIRKIDFQWLLNHNFLDDDKEATKTMSPIHYVYKLSAKGKNAAEHLEKSSGNSQ